MVQDDGANLSETILVMSLIAYFLEPQSLSHNIIDDGLNFGELLQNKGLGFGLYLEFGLDSGFGFLNELVELSHLVERGSIQNDLFVLVYQRPQLLPRLVESILGLWTRQDGLD